MKTKKWVVLRTICFPNCYKSICRGGMANNATYLYHKTEAQAQAQCDIFNEGLLQNSQK